MSTDTKDTEATAVAPEAATAPSPEKEPEPPIEVPEEIFLNDLHEESAVTLHEKAMELKLRVPGNCSKFQLIHEIVGFYLRRGTHVEADGVLDTGNDGFGFLRWPRYSFSTSADCIYVSAQLINQSKLKAGSRVRGVLKVPTKNKEKYLALETVKMVEDIPFEDWDPGTPFDKLTPLFASERILLENKKTDSISSRVVDLLSPMGKGQRGLIVAAPRSGKTILLKDIAKSIRINHPEIELIILLIDERPEEVTDFKETVDASVFSSTFDETPKRHIQVTEMVAERAKRLVEMKKDVVILLDSITRLSRGYNNMRGGSGRIMSGGIDSKAMQKPNRFFGSARNVEEGGSLTILATALVETESKMDTIIFEEFKGKGNMEVHLDRELVEKRIFPAIHSLKSGTRKDDLLYHPDELPRIMSIRRQMAQLPVGEGMEILVKNIKRTSSNAELLLSGLK